MSQKRIRQGHRRLPDLLEVDCGFICVLLAMLRVFEAMVDTKSGEFRSPTLAEFIFAAFASLIAIIFYADFKFQRKRRSGVVRADQRVRM